MWKPENGESVNYLNRFRFVSTFVFNWPHFKCIKTVPYLDWVFVMVTKKRTKKKKKEKREKGKKKRKKIIVTCFYHYFIFQITCKYCNPLDFVLLTC